MLSCALLETGMSGVDVGGTGQDSITQRLGKAKDAPKCTDVIRGRYVLVKFDNILAKIGGHMDTPNGRCFTGNSSRAKEKAVGAINEKDLDFEDTTRPRSACEKTWSPLEVEPDGIHGGGVSEALPEPPSC